MNDILFKEKYVYATFPKVSDIECLPKQIGSFLINILNNE